MIDERGCPELSLVVVVPFLSPLLCKLKLPKISVVFPPTE
jgi:hypothetical protein